MIHIVLLVTVQLSPFLLPTVRMNVVVKLQNFIWKESFKYLPDDLL